MAALARCLRLARHAGLFLLVGMVFSGAASAQPIAPLTLSASPETFTSVGQQITITYSFYSQSAEYHTISINPNGLTVALSGSCFSGGVGIGETVTCDAIHTVTETEFDFGSFSGQPSWEATRDTTSGPVTDGGSAENFAVLRAGADVTPPIVNVPADIEMGTDPGSNTAIVSYTTPTATDDVDGALIPVLTEGPVSGSAFPLGVTRVTWEARDAADNTSTASFNVTVRDLELPVISGTPSNIVLLTDPGAATAVATWTEPTASDNVAVTSFDASHDSGDTFPLGTTTVTYQAMDAAGNQAQTSFTVTVNDGEAPVFASFPSDQSIEIDFGESGATATWSEPVATDNSSSASVTQIAGPPSGSVFPVGATTVTYEARDGADNVIEQSFTVTVSVIPPGGVTFVVNSPADGTFAFSSGEPALNATVSTSGGTGSSGELLAKPGTYSVSFTVPADFSVTDAFCDDGVSALDASSRTGTIVLTSGNSVVCTISSVDSVSETTELIGSFLQARAGLLLQSQPDRGRRLARLNGLVPSGSSFGVAALDSPTAPLLLAFSDRSASFAVSLSRAEAFEPVVSPAPGPFAQFASATYPDGADSTSDAQPVAANAPQPFDIWVEGALAGFDVSGGSGRFASLQAGADYLVAPDLLVGLGLQYDWTGMDTATGASVSGWGFLLGPYMTARLADHLYLDGRVAWGRAYNEISPFGTYEDSFGSERWLATLALIGGIELDRFTVSPEARVSYFREESGAYRDSLGANIPEVAVETGELEFGITIDTDIDLGNGATLTPFADFRGIWSFSEDTMVAGTASGIAGEEGLRGRIEGGFDLTGQTGPSFSASAFYDGIGDDRMEAWGGMVRLSGSF